MIPGHLISFHTMTTVIPLTLKIPDSLTHARETHRNSTEQVRVSPRIQFCSLSFVPLGPLIHGYLDPITWWLSF